MESPTAATMVGNAAERYNIEKPAQKPLDMNGLSKSSELADGDVSKGKIETETTPFARERAIKNGKVYRDNIPFSSMQNLTTFIVAAASALNLFNFDPLWPRYNDRG